jgi:hypothetical protein
MPNSSCSRGLLTGPKPGNGKDKVGEVMSIG